MGNDPSWFIIGGMVKGEAMVCAFFVLSTVSLLPLLYSHRRALWFFHSFLFFLALFFVTTGVGKKQGTARMTQYIAHMQQFMLEMKGST